MTKKPKQEEEVYRLTPKGLFGAAMGWSDTSEDNKKLDNFMYEVITYMKRFEMWHGMDGHAAIMLIDGDLEFVLVCDAGGEDEEEGN